MYLDVCLFDLIEVKAELYMDWEGLLVYVSDQTKMTELNLILLPSEMIDLYLSHVSASPHDVWPTLPPPTFNVWLLCDRTISGLFSCL